MFLYAGKSFTASATGQELKDVACEKCGASFHYMLSRTATGRASAPYYVAQDAARNRAENQAKARLKKRLQRDAELVPCPHCHWINHDLIARFRKSQYKPLSFLALVLLLIGGVVDFILYISDIVNQPGKIPPEIAGVAVVTAVIVFFLLLTQFLLRRGINPNRHADGHPKVPVGTPPALIKSLDPVTRKETLAAVPSDLSNLQAEARWVTFRPGQLVFEPLCCECLEPAETHFRFPIPIDGKTLAVPLCHACLQKLQTQWWLRNLAAIPVAVLAGWLLSRLAAGADAGGRIAIIAFAGGFLTLVAVVINDRTLRPYRLKIADRSRHIAKIRFHNPAYTALLIRKLGQQDGLYEPASPSESQTLSTK